ncbi:DUF397 domain-containing protein [Streptomyces coelicoflavus]|uniref:DUF397 domain-containing protein n=1 Tax=Streptomyces coelicoflavus TaxID=285562 RepID=UPI00365A2B1E
MAAGPVREIRGSKGNNCVEVAPTHATIHVRDSEDTSGRDRRSRRRHGLRDLRVAELTSGAVFLRTAVPCKFPCA